MEPFATLEDLQARLDWTLDASEQSVATSALEDLSESARFYGREWDDVGEAPRMVRTLVLKAAARFMRNPDGYTQSRAGDETLMWNDRQGENAGTAYFTTDEIKTLRALSGQVQGLVSATISAWDSKICGTRYNIGYVPVAGSSEKPFPFFCSSDPADPW